MCSPLYTAAAAVCPVAILNEDKNVACFYVSRPDIMSKTIGNLFYTLPLCSFVQNLKMFLHLEKKKKKVYNVKKQNNDGILVKRLSLLDNPSQVYFISAISTPMTCCRFSHSLDIYNK